MGLVLREEADQKQAIASEIELISELGQEITIEESDLSTPDDFEKEEEKIEVGRDVLIAEEEQLNRETDDMIIEAESNC